MYTYIYVYMRICILCIHIVHTTLLILVRLLVCGVVHVRDGGKNVTDAFAHAVDGERERAALAVARRVVVAHDVPHVGRLPDVRADVVGELFHVLDLLDKILGAEPHALARLQRDAAALRPVVRVIRLRRPCRSKPRAC